MTAEYAARGREPLGEHHLSSMLSAYVDGQLTAAEAERVEGHLAVCAECAAAVEEISDVRGMLATPPIIAPSESLLAQLSLIEDAQSAGLGEETNAKQKWPTRLLVAAFGVAASMALLAVLGTYDLPDVSGNVAQRAQNSLLNTHTSSPRFMASANVADSEPALEPELRSLAARTASLEIIAVTRDFDRDEVEVILTLDAAQAVVRERRGKLPVGDQALGRIAEISGYEVQVLEQAPWTALWQRGDRVISVAADAPHDTIALIIESFPPAPVDEGIGARVMRGVHKVGQVIG